MAETISHPAVRYAFDALEVYENTCLRGPSGLGRQDANSAIICMKLGKMFNAVRLAGRAKEQNELWTPLWDAINKVLDHQCLPTK